MCFISSLIWTWLILTPTNGQKDLLIVSFGVILGSEKSRTSVLQILSCTLPPCQVFNLKDIQLKSIRRYVSENIIMAYQNVLIEVLVILLRVLLLDLSQIYLRAAHHDSG